MVVPHPRDMSVRNRTAWHRESGPSAGGAVRPDGCNQPVYRGWWRHRQGAAHSACERV